MITREEALIADRFHYQIPTVFTKGGKKCEVWRRNGKTQIWKTRPTHFRVPIKHGLYDYSQLWHHDAGTFHTEEACSNAE